MAGLESLAAGAAAVSLLPALGFCYQQVGDRLDAKRFPPPGRLVDIGGLRLHSLTQGPPLQASRGQVHGPSVIFDSALASSSISWALVQPRVARRFQTLSYDRAGSGWSDPSPRPRRLENTVDELYRLVKALELPPPYLIVGHSYGGFTARFFAHRHRKECAGLVLLDAADEHQWIDLKPEDERKIVQGARLARRARWLAHLGLTRLVVQLARAGNRGKARSIGSALGVGLPRQAQQRLLAPLQQLPEDLRRPIGWFWTRPHFYASLADTIARVPQAARTMADISGYGNLPLAVLAADNEDPVWLPRQKALAKLSRRGCFVHAQNSSHWIPLDRPQLVADTIRDLLRQ
ncbi:MAG TPA: alpha/beta fold hydrolase [Acidobacteriota bacterium]|nr:alpha/beta fold hydrolase [Acidobacteriota bacterium]